MNLFLNFFFFAFHTMLIIFNLAGWAYRPTRKLHLFTMLLTAFSWFVIGIWKGWGFCFSTDWHWQVRAELGYNEHFDSYIQFLIYKISGVTIDAVIVETLTAIVFFLCLALSIVFNFKDRQMKALEDWREVHGKPLKRRDKV